MGLFAKFKAGLQKTHSKLAHEIKRIITRSPKLDAAALEDLEAALIAADRPAPRTHSLVLLLDTCAGPTAAPDETLRAAAALNEYGIGPRYPGSYPPATLAQARAARADADAVCGWALARFG